MAAVRTRAPELVVDGPIRYDTAMGGGADVPGKSPVAGRATVLVFPDLEVADSAYRMMRTRVDATVYGPLLQGLRLPVNAVSRDATVEEIVSMVAVTAVQAQTPADRPPPRPAPGTAIGPAVAGHFGACTVTAGPFEAARRRDHNREAVRTTIIT